MGFDDSMDAEVWRLNGRKGQPGDAWAEREVLGVQKNAMSGWDMDGGTKFVDRNITAPATDAAKQWAGWGTALKPAMEPITVARKPLDGTVAENVLAHGTGAINVDGCRVATTGEGRTREGEASRDRRYTDEGSTNFAATPGPRGGDPAGRWPANLIHDGSDEVVGLFPQTTSGSGQRRPKPTENRAAYMAGWPANGYERDGDSGSAARFFYCAKASKAERGEGNNHPTVKPLALMRYLCRLVTPPGGVVLDPFAGSGTTLMAALCEDFRVIGIERDEGYAAIARARVSGRDGPLFDEADAPDEP